MMISDGITHRLKKAYFILGKLDYAVNSVPNQALFLSMYIRKEALLSNQIEGTQATLDDILNPSLKHNKNMDVEGCHLLP